MRQLQLQVTRPPKHNELSQHYLHDQLPRQVAVKFILEIVRIPIVQPQLKHAMANFVHHDASLQMRNNDKNDESSMVALQIFYTNFFSYAYDKPEYNVLVL